MSRHLKQLLNHQWASEKYLCVGLDIDVERFPDYYQQQSLDKSIRSFCNDVIDITAPYTAAYKFNSAYFERYGVVGIEALKVIIERLINQGNDIPIIIDAKRGDIATTNVAYAENIFDYFLADAVTVHPYLGEESLQPFINREQKGVFILSRTSNSGSGEFQDLICDGLPLYLHVAKNVAYDWQARSSAYLGLVMGATYVDSLARVRDLSEDIPLLIPGFGAQGGNLSQTMKAVSIKDQKPKVLLNVSRSIIYAGGNTHYLDNIEIYTRELTKKISASVQQL